MVQFKFENSQDSLGKLFFVIISYSFKKKKNKTAKGKQIMLNMPCLRWCLNKKI